MNKISSLLLLFLFTNANANDLYDLTTKYYKNHNLDPISNIKLNLKEENLGDSFGDRELCNIFININKKYYEFILYHEISHCYQNKDFIFEENTYPIYLSAEEKSIYDRLLILWQKNNTKYANPAFVYSEMLADANATWVLGFEDKNKYLLEIANIRKEDWKKNISSNNYPTSNLIKRVSDANNNTEINEIISDEYSKYLMFMSKYYKFSLQ